MIHLPFSAALCLALRGLRFSLLCFAFAMPALAKNHLAGQKSPYLLQHADNPVDWYPWGDEAFDLAKKEGKPVFLSIGYSTCHWCHVMAHESFEDQDTADFLNKHFISIKLDREERPDLDSIYMNYQQAVHGNGGWPLSIWMSPDRIPFFTGTYFPKKASPGQITFMDMLARIREAWDLHHDDIRKDSARILERMDEIFNAPPREADAQGLSKDLLATAFEQLSGTYDPQLGGFGSRPKFPQPSVLAFLFEYAASLEPGNPVAARAREMVLVTLRKMALGGIHDHLGGGFHRYSVDEFWHVPHFEKMLYDQAQIASIYLDAFRISGDPFFKEVALDVFRYVERQLSHPDGAFHCAEDADSLDPAGVHKEKIEGAFYVWSTEEIQSVVGAENAPVFIAAYDVKPRGNAPPGSDPFGEFKDKNILFRKKSAADLAAEFNKPAEEIETILAAGRTALLAARAKRPRPHLDDKVLTSWNALIISAYARAHEVLGGPVFLEHGERAARFIEKNLYDAKTKTLLRSYRNGPSAIQGTADDYAFFIQALLDLHEASQEIHWLELALDLQDTQIALLEDKKNGGFFDSPESQTDLILRLKSSHDGAEPAANSVSAFNLLRLSALIKSDRYDAALDGIFKNFAGGLVSNPVGQAALLSALGRKLDTPAQIVIAGKPDDPATRAILDQIRGKYLPNKVVLVLDDGPGRAFLAARNDLFAAFQPIDGKPTLYLCRNYACQKPANNPKEIAAQLDGL